MFGGAGTRDTEFSDYVAQRRPVMYRTAYLLCGGDPHRAEDIVQTALVKVYVAWSRVSRADSVDAYVRRAVVNAHLDDVRRPWRRERTVAEVGDRMADQPLALEESDALWSALRRLPPGQRRVVVLRHYWGLSVEETAADLAINTGTVKSQTADALANLRAALVTADNVEGS